MIQAEARATADQVEVVLREIPITGITRPESIVRNAIRTHESVILNDVSKQGLFSEDDYLCREQAKSILCIPLIASGPPRQLPMNGPGGRNRMAARHSIVRF